MIDHQMWGIVGVPYFQSNSDRSHYFAENKLGIPRKLMTQKVHHPGMKKTYASVK